MSNVNKKPTLKQSLSERKDKTTNFMGEPAYILELKERLLNMVLTNLFGEPSYYGNQDKKVIADMKEMAQKDPEFILKLAAYARNEMYLRTFPVIMLVESANMAEFKGKGYVRKYTPFIIDRVDELMGALAYHIKNYKTETPTIPMSLLRGMKKAFEKFDEYQFDKYDKGKSKVSVTLLDALRLIHPKPANKEREALYKKIKDGNLKTAETWEQVLMTWKERGYASKAKAWEHMIDEWTGGKYVKNYMALIRNLRNILKDKVSAEHMDKVARAISDPGAVRHSRQFPFRFLSAYEALEASPGTFESERAAYDKFRQSLNEAIKISAQYNIPKIPGKTVVITDNSGSARSDWGGKSMISLKSVRTMADAGNLLGLLTWYASDDVMFGVFGDKLTLLTLDRNAGILDNFKKVDEAGAAVGQATEQGVFTMLQKMIDEKIVADRIVVCSDLQIGDGKNQEYGLNRYSGSQKTVPELVDEYRRKVNPNFYYYSVCFKGYGDDVMVGSKKALINGWNDKILKFITMFEKDKVTQVKEIEAYVPGRSQENQN